MDEFNVRHRPGTSAARSTAGAEHGRASALWLGLDDDTAADGQKAGLGFDDSPEPILTDLGSWGRGTFALPEGSALRAFRRALGLAGYPSPSTSSAFSRGDVLAILAFQNDHGLACDGLPGESTARALDSALPIQIAAQDSGTWTAPTVRHTRVRRDGVDVALVMMRGGADGTVEFIVPDEEGFFVVQAPSDSPRRLMAAWQAVQLATDAAEIVLDGEPVAIDAFIERVPSALTANRVSTIDVAAAVRLVQATPDLRIELTLPDGAKLEIGSDDAKWTAARRTRTTPWSPVGVDKRLIDPVANLLVDLDLCGGGCIRVGASTRELAIAFAEDARPDDEAVARVAGLLRFDVDEIDERDSVAYPAKSSLQAIARAITAAEDVDARALVGALPTDAQILYREPGGVAVVKVDGKIGALRRSADGTWIRHDAAAAPRVDAAIVRALTLKTGRVHVFSASDGSLHVGPPGVPYSENSVPAKEGQPDRSAAQAIARLCPAPCDVVVYIDPDFRDFLEAHQSNHGNSGLYRQPSLLAVELQRDLDAHVQRGLDTGSIEGASNTGDQFDVIVDGRDERVTAHTSNQRELDAQSVVLFRDRRTLSIASPADPSGHFRTVRRTGKRATRKLRSAEVIIFEAHRDAKFAEITTQQLRAHLLKDKVLVWMVCAHDGVDRADAAFPTSQLFDDETRAPRAIIWFPDQVDHGHAMELIDALEELLAEDTVRAADLPRVLRALAAEIVGDSTDPSVLVLRDAVIQVSSIEPEQGQHRG